MLDLPSESITQSIKLPVEVWDQLNKMDQQMEDIWNEIKQRKQLEVESYPWPTFTKSINEKSIP